MAGAEQVSHDVKRRLASCFVAVEAATSTVAGFYTLAATSVQASDLPPEILKLTVQTRCNLPSACSTLR